MAGAGPAGIIFEGAFTPQEREFLAGQFSRCRWELLARSALDDRIALVRWQPLARGKPAGPRPLFAAPTYATYVLDLSAGRGDPPGRPGGPATRAGGRSPGLLRVDDTAALTASYADHFPGAHVKTPGWLRLRRAWHRAIPLLIAVLAATWLALVWWQMRGA